MHMAYFLRELSTLKSQAICWFIFVIWYCHWVTSRNWKQG